ncbi:hypothetical protein [Actinocorallia aurantiaca]|uniref:hypothetical protein n=1 Tax=Actinocorallia aurantiaca TaxID=46204 RepID=UPI0031DFF75E
MTFTVTLSLGQSTFPKDTVSGRAAGADVVGTGAGVLVAGPGTGVVFVGAGVAVLVGVGVAVFVVGAAVGEALRLGLAEAGGGVPVGGDPVAEGEGSVVEEASEVLFPPVKAGITISAPITKKIAAMITLTGCIPAPPESIA